MSSGAVDEGDEMRGERKEGERETRRPSLRSLGGKRCSRQLEAESVYAHESTRFTQATPVQSDDARSPSAFNPSLLSRVRCCLSWSLGTFHRDIQAQARLTTGTARRDPPFGSHRLQYVSSAMAVKPFLPFPPT